VGGAKTREAGAMTGTRDAIVSAGDEPMELPLRCADGHSGRLLIALASDGGWDVRAEVDANVVSIGHCPDWHRVERFCVRLEEQLRIRKLEC
jgi:hypothetical protein